ncbi:MAG: DNA-directed RNA polymerase subunit D, partial [Candidatus Thermoplasmatota archaeon]|nr:DNA-directed RNA polymerase subunit D [Candidatus Thermoplasmatota archaeon]
IVAHRLGLVPLRSDLKMNFRDECSCKGAGCPLCTVTYSINKLGPCTVTSGDIMPLGNPDAAPVDTDIPIVKLGNGQAMLVSAEAIMGRGSEHAKWQATSGVSYKYHREYILDKKIFTNWKEVSEAYPDSVVENTQKRLVLTDDYHLRGLSSLVEMPGVSVSEDNTRFIFRFETDGSLTAREVLEYSLKRLPQRLNVLLESISGYGD